MTHHRFSISTRPIRLLAVPAAAALVLGLTACGGSSGQNATASADPGIAQGGGARQGGPAMFANAKVRACLRKQGVAFPGRPSGGQGGQPPSGQTGTAPQGTPPGAPQGGQPPSGIGSGGTPANSAQFKKLQAALKACGVTMPSGPPSGGSGYGSGGQTPPAPTTTQGQT
ncbi:MAG TPA: hypothetical protein VMT10_08900 [Solirubrobacteraceae bacterium]|nr:hypothetical protein [Solirubrobacteraceae bacterium]